MSSNINALTKERLFACLEYDGVAIDTDKINKAKNNDGEALRHIGNDYYNKLKDYSKAMAWYQLAANQNEMVAYNNIGNMYYFGLGVSQDYITAMEYYLTAARDNHKNAMTNIGILFFNGKGVPADKYRALKWLTKSGDKPEKAKELNKQGIHLTEEDKNKTIYQLINEAHDIIREERIRSKTMESKSREEIEELKKTKSSNEQETQRLEKELQQQMSLLEQERQKSGSSTQLISNLEQRLTDKMEIINVYQTLVQSKNIENNLLNQKYENIENENLELKRKLEEYQRCSQGPRLLIDSSNSANNDNNTTNNTIELNNQAPLNDMPNGNVDNIIVKTEAESENNSSPSCQVGNKKRKVSSNVL